jgi:imidazoleglycerol phosphate dehydratase HisB
MIIRRSIRLQFRPHDFESLVLEAEVTLDTTQFEGDDHQAEDHVQETLEDLLAVDLERAQRVDTEGQTFVKEWMED